MDLFPKKIRLICMGVKIIVFRANNHISELRYVKLVHNPARGPSLGVESLLCLRIVMLDYCGLLPQVFDDPGGL